MRNPKRIDKILKQIKIIWKQNPDLRMCQLIGNCFDAGDLYYVEDSLLKERLEKVYLNNEENKEKENKT